MDKYLIKYLLDHEEDILRRRYIEYFKTEMDWFIYSYGDHISITHQKKQPSNIIGYVARYAQYLFSLMTNVHINDGFINILTKFGIPELGDNYRFYSSVLSPYGYSNIIGDLHSIRVRERKQRIINKGMMWDLLDEKNIEDIEKLKVELINRYANYNFGGLFLHTDQYFETKILIDVFKQLNIPSLVFIHGLPAEYSLDLYNRSDYLMVWGEKMKEYYVKAGFNSNKVIVVGNRNYPLYKNSENLRNSFDDILIIPPSAALWHQDTWGEPSLIDRSSAILYLYQVQTVLRKLGITHARYRLHPSISKKWTDQFLDHGFYQIDTLPLTQSLHSATMVIGSASSVLFDAVAHGVNYILYEPQENGKSILGTALIPPFDGSDGFIVAKNEDELNVILKERTIVPAEGIRDYMEPFNPSKIRELLR